MADFQDQAYTFSVESVLGPHQGFGRLLIEASAGYLLTTPSNTTPQPEQTVSYAIQPDGSRVARSTVTLLATGPSMVNGSVMLRDPLGEAVMLKIHVTSQISQPVLAPLLTVSGSELVFNRMEVGEEGFAILKISQQGTDTPVLLSTDDPAQFGLATGVKELNFGSDLTLTPLPNGTYVHIRYRPNRTGRHLAHLFIEAPYDTKTVSLQGQAVGLLPIVLPKLRSSPHTRPSMRLPNPSAEPDTEGLRPVARRPQKRAVPALLLLGLGGLGFAGYAYRCQIAPSLCPDRNEVEAIVAPVDTAFVSREATTPDVNKEKLLTNNARKGPRVSKEPRPDKETAADAPRRDEKKKERSATAGDEDRIKTEPLADAKRRSSSQQKNRQQTRKNLEDESDLEKELNNNSNF